MARAFTSHTYPTPAPYPDAVRSRAYRVTMTTDYFLVPTAPASPTPPPTPPSRSAASSAAFRSETWVLPLLALSALTMLLIVAFEIFVLCKAWRTSPSRRHLFLGQVLLLGLFACAALGGLHAATPTPLTCALQRFGTGVAYATVFAALLVKCVFLISLNGGVYLPAPYQGLLLLFAVLIQVAIGAQWLLTSPPLVTHRGRSRTVGEGVHLVTLPLVTPRIRPLGDVSQPQVTLRTRPTIGEVVPQVLCRTAYSETLLSLVYVVFLIVFVAVLAAKSRGIRDNYREATYIGLAVGCSVPTWLVWTLSGFIVGERHRDGCIALGLVVTSALIFLIMFMPKGRQLAAMGKEGVYVEDREERFSELSRADSGYSPSFFHFKPVKCGYGTNLGTNNYKNQHTVTTIGGGDVALMYPPPPSYTRLFQCYPNPPGYYSSRYLPGGFFLRSDDGNVYTTLEPTLSSNPNVYFQRGNSGVHPGMMY